MKLIIPNPDQINGKEVRFTETINGKVINFVLGHDVTKPLESLTITSVAVIPFTSENEIIVTKLERGLDIPGGHVEKYDDTIIDTAVREAHEETGAKITEPVALIGVISSDLNGSSVSKTTYMIVLTSKAIKSDDFNPMHESKGSEVIDIDVFKEEYKAGSKDMMEELIKRAKGIRSELFSWK